MTEPTLHRAVNHAWTKLEKLVDDVLDEPDRRAINQVDVREVAATERVVVTDIKPARDPETRKETDQNPACIEHSYCGRKIPLSHRRYPLKLSEDELNLLADDEGANEVAQKVERWARRVLQQETLCLTDSLNRTAPVHDGLDAESVTAARELLPGDGGGAATLLVASDTPLDGQTNNQIRQALRGGPIIELPVTRERLCCAALLTAPDIPESVWVFVAIDFELGWNPENGVAVIHLNRRASDYFYPSDATRRCVPINPLSMEPTDASSVVAPEGGTSS